jgi:hypothetical protein
MRESNPLEPKLDMKNEYCRGQAVVMASTRLSPGQEQGDISADLLRLEPSRRCYGEQRAKGTEAAQ